MFKVRMGRRMLPWVLSMVLISNDRRMWPFWEFGWGRRIGDKHSMINSYQMNEHRHYVDAMYTCNISLYYKERQCNRVKRRWWCSVERESSVDHQCLQTLFLKPVGCRRIFKFQLDIMEVSFLHIFRWCFLVANALVRSLFTVLLIKIEDVLMFDCLSDRARLNYPTCKNSGITITNTQWSVRKISPKLCSNGMGCAQWTNGEGNCV